MDQTELMELLVRSTPTPVPEVNPPDENAVWTLQQELRNTNGRDAPR